MAMTPYAGWECSKCKNGSSLTRKRCRVCGRKRVGDELVKTFYRRPKRKWPWKPTKGKAA